MGLGRYNAAVRNTGSGKGRAQETSAAGVVTGSVFDLPWIKESTLSDTTDEVEIESEGEDTFTDEGKRTVKWDCTFLQRDKDTVEMMVKTYKGKYLTIVKEQSDKTVNSLYPYLAMMIAKVNPTVEIASPGSDVKAMFSLQAVQSTVTLDLSTFADSAFRTTLSGSATFSVAGYPYWQYVEIAAV